MAFEPARPHEIRDRLRAALQYGVGNVGKIRVTRNQTIYNHGDRESVIYLIECGRVKLHTLLPEGRECLLGIYQEGDIFGETCLAGLEERQETAVAMTDATLRKIPYSTIRPRLSDASLAESLIPYLAMRIFQQQQFSMNLFIRYSERRLGRMLLLLADSLGRPGPSSTRIEQRISHEELSEMVGTTRPRVSKFMRRFRELGLVDRDARRHLIIRMGKLSDYLSKMA